MLIDDGINFADYVIMQASPFIINGGYNSKKTIAKQI